MIELRDLKKTFHKASGDVQAVGGVSMQIAPESITALIGPSGCGKSTLLNMIAGLYAPTSGEVLYDGQAVHGANTDVGYMTQKDNLLPWRTVIDNVAMPLELAGCPISERHEKARAMLAEVGLSGFENKYSNELSGGMRKRACLARMLMYGPQSLLLDEPFAALDAQLRIAMHELLLKLWAQRKQVIVLVTHDLVEAICLADRVIGFTNRPAQISFECSIDLPRPRNVQDMRFTPEFHQIYNDIWGRMRGQYHELSS